MIVPADEVVEEIDLDGNVMRLVTRAEMRQGNLRHRCTYVAVVRPSGSLVVHQRASWKDVWPSFWDMCFGGVVGAGEDWEEAAKRELAEEAGIVGAGLEPLGSVSFVDSSSNIEGRAYLTVSDAELTCPDGEVERTDEIPMRNLGSWLESRDVCFDSASTVAPLVSDWWNRYSSGRT